MPSSHIRAISVIHVSYVLCLSQTYQILIAIKPALKITSTEIKMTFSGQYWSFVESVLEMNDGEIKVLCQTSTL